METKIRSSGYCSGVHYWSYVAELYIPVCGYRVEPRAFQVRGYRNMRYDCSNSYLFDAILDGAGGVVGAIRIYSFTRASFK